MIEKIFAFFHTGCPKELRGVVSANTGRAGIELQLGEIHHKLELPVGKYPYMISTGQQNCSLNVNILGRNISGHVKN